MRRRERAATRVELAGLRFRPATAHGLASSISTRLAACEGPPLVVGFVNPHVVTVGAEHPLVAQHLTACNHVCVDGIGVSLALRLRGQRTERLPAHRAFDRLVDLGVLQGRMLVIGIEPENVDQAARAIEQRGRGLEVVATVDGFASDDDIVEALRSVGPLDMVVIGAGSPRSEAIAELVRTTASARIVMHAGAGTLKVHAGVRHHAPAWVARVGLDWLYRFVNEPHTRPRYLHGIPAFIRLVRRVDPEPEPRIVPCE